VTSFASNIHRVQQVIDAAATLGRKSRVGRSMRKNVNIGSQLGHIEVPDGLAGRAARGRRLPRPPDGCDLDRLAGRAAVGAAGGWRTATTARWTLHPGDTVVFSATPIPWQRAGLSTRRSIASIRSAAR